MCEFHTVVLTTSDNTRSSCDLLGVFFTLEVYTDNRDGPSVQTICDATMDAILHPDNPRPSGECVMGEIARQLVTLFSAVVM
jgi:hypothetical protein